MADYEAKTGGRVLAIPHNSNLSAGLMFALEDRKGNAFSRDYAERRRRWEHGSSHSSNRLSHRPPLRNSRCSPASPESL